MAKLLFYRVRITSSPSWRQQFWRVTMPDGPVGRRHVTFKNKTKAEAFHRACQKELRRTKRVSLLTSPQKLIDCLEALRLLASVPDRAKLRKAAALYLLCSGEVKKEPAGFTEPESRSLELQPGLFRAIRKLAKEKNASVDDLVAGLLWQFVKEESEKKVPVIKNEEKIPLRFLL